jgi:alpha-beta hydrolase superfamily lysophospholipase
VHVDHFSDYANDVSAMLSHAKQRHPGLPIVILGHSMGGLISLTYALNYPDDLDGAVLSSPALGTHPDARPPAILNLLVRVLVRIKPRMLFPSDLDNNAISRDPDVVRAYIDDPLVSEKVSASWYVEITKAIEDIQGRAAELKIPTLLMQSGADRLVDPQAAPRWAKDAPKDILRLVVWDELFHEMFNEPEKDKVFACVLDWLSQKFPTQDTSL